MIEVDFITQLHKRVRVPGHRCTSYLPGKQQPQHTSGRAKFVVRNSVQRWTTVLRSVLLMNRVHRRSFRDRAEPGDRSTQVGVALRTV